MKRLYKVTILKDMSKPLASVRASFENRAKTVCDHTIKCIISNESRNYWIKEITSRFYELDDLTYTPNVKKLSSDEIKELLFFSEVRSLNEANLKIERTHNKFEEELKIKYSINKKMGEALWNIYNECIKMIVPMLADKNEYSYSSYLSKVNEIIYNNVE